MPLPGRIASTTAKMLTCPPVEGAGRNLWISAGVYPALDTGLG